MAKTSISVFLNDYKKLAIFQNNLFNPLLIWQSVNKNNRARYKTK